MISAETCARLEFGTLLAEIETHAASPVTRERIRGTLPLTDRDAIDLTAGRIAELRALDRLGITPAISSFDDIRPLLEQLRPAGAILPPEGLLLFIPVLRCCAALARQFAPRGDIPLLKRIDPQPRPFPEILEPLEASIDHDGSIKDGASPLLAGTRRAKRGLAARIRKKIEEIVQKEGIEIFLQDDFITQRSGRWVIPVRMDSKGMVKGVVHDVSSSGETAFMEPLEIIPFVNELENLTAEEKAEEIRILRQLSAWLREDSPAIAACFETLLELDRLNAAARFAEQFGLERIALNEEGRLMLSEARHPLLMLLEHRRQIGRVEPLDLVLGGDDSPGGSVMVITGPNAGGKTISIKTAGMICLMALCGLPAPASPRSTLPLLDSLLVDIGDEQSIARSHSTFSAHAARVAGIISQAGPRSLVLLDELGAGTEPLQGAAIACGVLKALQENGATVIATTHLGEIVGFVHRTPGMLNAGMAYDDRSYTPLYRLVAGEPGQSHALDIARRFGMPEPVLKTARAILGNEGSEFASLMADLRRRRVELEEMRAALCGRERQLEERAAELDARSAELANVRREAAEKAWGEARELISSGRRRMNELLEELKREKRGVIAEEIRAVEKHLTEQLAPSGGIETVPLREVRPGDTVHVRSLGCGATVLLVDERHGRARVRAGRMEVEVPLETLCELRTAPPPKKTPPRGGSWKADVIESDTNELKLIGLRVDEALAQLEPFLNHAAAGGLRELRVIHGIGSGRLRDAVREELERHPLVESYRPGNDYEGRDGATVVSLKG